MQAPSGPLNVQRCQLVEINLLSWQQPGLFPGDFWSTAQLDETQSKHWKLRLVIRDGQQDSISLTGDFIEIIFAQYRQVPLHQASIPSLKCSSNALQRYASPLLSSPNPIPPYLTLLPSSPPPDFSSPIKSTLYLPTKEIHVSPHKSLLLCPTSLSLWIVSQLSFI